jgi:hypothetical protein
MIGDDDAEHGVAEKLEPLIRLLARVLGAPRAMRESGREQLGVTEAVPKALFERDSGGR